MAIVWDFDLAWDFNDPVGTREVFRSKLEKSENDEYRYELKTQIARTHSLTGEFEEAHSILDEVDRLGLPGRVKIRSHLERGRTFNSAGSREQALPLFKQALELSGELGEEFFAVDAAHMIAIAEGPEYQEEWNLKAIEMAGRAVDERARAWRGSLLNNLGWTYHAAGRYEEALQTFKQALDARVEQGKEGPILVAGWCVARTLRSLGLIEDALNVQRGLAAAHREKRTSDGYVEEEIGECLLALGRSDEAVAHFGAAYKSLQDELSAEPERLDRIRALSKNENSEL